MAKDKRKNEELYTLNPVSLIFSGIFRVISGLLRGTWWMVRKTGQGAWWAIRGLSRNAWKAVRGVGRGIGWLVKLPQRFIRYIISGRVPEFENARQEETFWRIKRQYRRKRLFLLHSIAFLAGIFLSIAISASEYLNLLRLSENPAINMKTLWLNYNEMLLGMGIGLFVWTFIIIGHFIFNRIGNEEDHALGDALEREYARSDSKTLYDEHYERLMDSPYEDDEPDYEEKPKHKQNVR